MNCRWLLIGLLSWLALPAMAMDFDALLAESELLFSPPEGYQAMGGGSNSVLNHERALRSPDGKLEIRYALRPLKRLKVDYDDPHGAVPDPNHIFPLMFESLLSQMAAGRHAPSRHYSAQDAAQRFNADWAAAGVFDAGPALASQHSQGLLLALHRNKVSDAYVIFLYDDYEQVKAAIKAAMDSLVYRPRAEAQATAAVEQQ